MLLDPFVPHWQVLPGWETAPIVAAIKPWLLPIWGVGALLFCVKVLLGLVALLRIERSSTELRTDPWETMVSECRQDLGIRKPVRLLHFPGRIMPMTWGVLRNFVVLPSSAARWSGQRVRAVLMHELAHIRRGDYVASLLRDAVCAFYWFHPLVWWAAKEMDEDREEASDDAVIAAGQRPADYASHLATIATRGLVIDPQVHPKVALAEKPLLLRIRSILTPWKSRHPITRLQRFQLGTILGLMLAALLLIGPRQPSTSSALSQNPTVIVAKAPAYVSSEHGAKMLPLGKDQNPETVKRWEPTVQPWDLEGEALGTLSNTGDHNVSVAENNDSNKDTSDRDHQPGIATNDTLASPLAGVSNTLTVQRDKEEEPIWVLTSPGYSTSPPEESEEGPESVNISDVVALENVGHIAVDNFDLGGLGELGDDVLGSSGSEPVIDIEFDSIQVDGGFFSIASLTKTPSRLPNATVKQAPTKGTTRQVPVLESVGSAKHIPTPGISAAHTRPDAGLLTQVGFVTNEDTGDRHLAITFKRKSNGPTAKFHLEASPNMVLDNWDLSPNNFAKILNRNIYMLREPISVSPFRFLRIRSSSPVPPTPSGAPSAD